MKRSPLGASSVWPVRLMLTPMRACCTEATNTFCTLLESPDTDSTKHTRSLLPVSANTPGLTRDTSSRACTREWYCSPFCAAQGDLNSERTAITAICGRANIITGLSHAVSGRPPPNHDTIAESRQP